MVFEQEINIYSDEAIIKQFRAVETSFSVVRGKISAMISESELIELQNSKATMYSKLASAIMDISSLTLNFSDLTTKYNTVSGQYTALDSKVAQYKLGVDGLSADITAVKKDLTDNYSDTTTMNAAIKSSFDEISASVSKTYAKQTDLTTTNGKITELESWKNEASLKITDSAIVSTVTSSSSWGNKVDKNQLISQINQSAEQIAIQASKINLEGLITANSYFKILMDGSIVAYSGIIGGWELTPTTFRSTTSDKLIIDAANASIYSVRNNGNKGMTITADGMKFYAWDSDGDYVGRITTTRDIATGTYKQISLTCDEGDALTLGVLSESGSTIRSYVKITDTTNAFARAGVNIYYPLHMSGRIYFYGSTGTYNNLYIGSDSGGLWVNGNTMVSGNVTATKLFENGYPVITGNIGNRIRLEWNGSRLVLSVDGTTIGKVVTN